MKTFHILYSSLLNPKSVGKFSMSDRKKIKNSIERKLTTQPDIFGKPLRRNLRGYWSLRIGEYRVIYRIQESNVLILVIEHRSVVYDLAKRLFE